MPFEFRLGDRVVLVGDTFIERDQKYGYLETLLTLAHPDLRLTFRNLGWSGDTVAGLSRAGFDPPEAGFRELKAHILAAAPTVAIVGYGMADSFDGPAGLPRFVKGLNALLDVIATTGARVILVSPIPHEDLGRPLPDPAAHNRELTRYAEAIRSVAAERSARFIDLIDWFKSLYAFVNTSSAHHYTDNGIHLTESGYAHAAQAILARLGHALDNPVRHVVIRGDGTVLDSRGIRVTGVRTTATGLEFDAIEEALGPRLPDSPSQPNRDLEFPGLEPGEYAMKLDGRFIAKADAAHWGAGVGLAARPHLDQAERLRTAIIEKNLLFFHRWRPQNVTYLFGFRKHEQGNNAIEVPRFDPLVEEKEREIATLCKPSTHHYELIRESEVAK